jgi:hypothetical protein
MAVKMRFVVEVTVDREKLKGGMNLKIDAEKVHRSLLGETTEGALDRRGYEVKVLSEGEIIEIKP